MERAFRILAVVAALLFMTGFGVCGAYGLILGLAPSGYGLFFVICGVIGLGIAALFFLALRALLKPDEPPGDNS